MTYGELDQYVWDRLPTLQRVGCGRGLVSRVIRRAVESWPVAVLQQCDVGQTQVVAKHYTRTIERAVRADVKMGFLAMLIFSAAVQEIIRILVRWWLERNENKLAMRLLVMGVRAS